MVPVPLGERAYEIVIGRGLLERVAELAAQRCPARHYAVIADSNVLERYAQPVRAQLARLAPVSLLTFPAGESSKNRDTWGRLTDDLLASGLGRDGAVVALGGGVTGDLAGFVAATYLRGVPWIQIPTTLLAMVDSSIGGKTGVDTAHGKNLAGAFHQPRVVIADVATLQSLPAPQFACGMAEVLKHAAIADAGQLNALCGESERILRRDPETMGEVVRRSTAVKAGIVAADEHEGGRRSILNFGHTVGHAIEAVSGFATPHGEAVAIGMLAEAEIGSRLGITRPAAIERLRAAIMTFGLPTSTAQELDPAACLAAMRSDKKVRDRTLRFALIRDLGEPARGPSGEWTVVAPPDLVLDVLGGLTMGGPNVAS